MKLIFVVLTTVIILASTLAASVYGQEGSTASGRHWQRPGSVSVTRGEMVNSGQGRYRQRGSAGDVVAVTTLGAAQVEGSLGFWWRSTETLPGDPEPPLIYLPVIFK
jgi:hypothetical protein